MMFLMDTLVGLTEAFVRRMKGVRREQVAKLFEKIATGVRNGDFIAERAFREYREDAENLDTAYDRLPD